MTVWAVGTVRNEADIIRLNVQHHHAQGVDRFLWLDNGSTDGTQEVLEQLSRELPLEWREQHGPFRQHELLTALVQEAYVRGADWVLPLDADEFWYAPGGTLPQLLQHSTAAALTVDVVNFVQRRDRLTTGEDALLSMTRRPPRQLGTVADVEQLVEGRDVAYVEVFYPPKAIVRATAAVQIGWGNHTIFGVHGAEPTSDIVCLHAPLRARSVLYQKVDAEREHAEISAYVQRAWHIRRWQRIAAAGMLAAEWAANSYEDGALDLYGSQRPLVEDMRLHDLVAPWLPGHHHAASATRSSSHRLAERKLAAADDAAELLRIRDEAVRWQEVAAALVAQLDEGREREHALREELDRYGKMLAANERLIHETLARAAHAETALAGMASETPRLHRARAALRTPELNGAGSPPRLHAQAPGVSVHVDELTRELDIIRATRSWRWTAPLRALHDTLMTRLSAAARARSSSNGASPPRAPAAVEAATDRAHDALWVPYEPARARVLLICDAVPTPDLDSGSFRLVQLIRIVRALGYEVTFVSDSSEQRPGYAAELRALGVPLWYGLDAALGHLQHEGQTYSAVIVARPEVASRYVFPVRAHASNARLIYDTVDLHWLRLSRQAQLLGDPVITADAERVRRMEMFACESSDLVLAVTAEEQRALLAQQPQLRVAVLPNVHPPVPSGPPWSARSGLFFIGGFWHSPNVDAMQYFVAEILPLIRQSIPDVVLTIAGSNMPGPVAALASPSVRTIGYAPDPEPHFHAARVFVAPLRFGAGMKGKVGQSMSYGLPVVTTSVGAEGMLLRPGDTALIADEPAAFSRAVIELYRDAELWQQLATRSRAHIAQHFSVESATERLRALLPPVAGIPTPAVARAG